MLTATTYPSNANVPTEVSITSSDPAVAEVNVFGLVTAKAPGKATITLKAGVLTATCEVTVYDPNHQHNGAWIADGDSHYRICTICGELETGSHQWGQWGVTLAATCDTPGIRYHSCELCGVLEYVPEPALGHMESAWKYDKDGHWTSCLNEGCGEILHAKEAHSFDETFTCTTCGYVMPEEDRPIDTSLCPRDETCPMSQFEDLIPTKWYHDGVHYCLVKGLMNGMSSTKFAPNDELTRAMVVVLLYRIEGSPAVSGDIPFEDVPTGKWYSDAILWAHQNGIANGTTATRFEPFTSVTRQQTAAFMFRYAQVIGRDVSARADLSSFPDADRVSGYAVDAVSWAVAEGIIQGVAGDGAAYLRPKGTTTRAQYATIIYRFLEN